jgi:hypothetical protein
MMTTNRLQSEISSQTTVFSLLSRCGRDDKLKTICMQDVFSLIAARPRPASSLGLIRPGLAALPAFQDARAAHAARLDDGFSMSA